MSLIHWWPLCSGNILDTITGQSLTAKNVITTTNKLGPGYGFTPSEDSRFIINTNGFHFPQNNFTVTLWFKYNTWNTPYATLFALTKEPSWLGNICTIARAGSGSSVHFCVSDGTNYTASSCNTGNLDLGRWYHLAAVYSGDKIQLYLDGELKSTYSNPPVPNFNLVVNGNIGRLDSSYYQTDSQIQDVRMYDHALSLLEIQELSKALIVHYTFNDTFGESTTNVGNVSGWSAYGSYWTISDKTDTGLKLYRHTGSTNTVVALQNSSVTSKMSKGEKWTFSCYLYRNGQPFKTTRSYLSSTDYNYRSISYTSQDDGYYSNTFEVFGSPGTWVIHADLFEDVGTNIECEMRYMQFEKKEHATPFTPSSRTTWEIANEAGYNYNATLNLPENFSLVTDTNCGKYALRNVSVNPSARINIDINPSFIDGTGSICFWYKKDPTAFNNNGGHFLVATQASSGYYFGAMDGTHVWHSGASHSKFYIDGVAVSNDTSASDTNWHFYCFTGVNLASWRSLSLHAHGDTSWLYTGNISDFRIYNTVLESRDIEDLYRTKGYISNRGDIACGQFIEGQEAAQLTVKYNCEADQVTEIIDDYEPLEYIESTGSQHMFTGVYSSENITGLRAHFYQTTYPPGQILFGAYDGVSTYYFCYKEANGYPLRSHWRYTDLTTTAQWTANMDIKASLYNNNGSLTYTANGHSVTKPVSKGQNGSYDMVLFAYNDRNTVGYNMYCRLYSFEIDVDNILVRKYIPMRRRSDGVAGLYDLVHNTFTISSSGAFIAGPVLTADGATFFKNKTISARNIIEI